MVTKEEFAALTQEEQVSRLKRLGWDALHQFGVHPDDVTPLVHAENTTFRVTSPEGKFCLRISRPGYQSRSNIESEILFLDALKHEGLPAPRPYRPVVISASDPSVPEARDCVLLHWLEGEFANEGYSPAQARCVGQVMARMQRFSQQWTPPAGFDRQRIHRALERDSTPSLETRPDNVSEEDFLLLREVDAESREMVRGLPQTPAFYGLVHADLHRGNVLFEGEVTRVIDFDDLGWAFWLYDFASALGLEVDRDEFPAVRDALLTGYTDVAPLPPQTEELLSSFLRLRLTGLAAWVLSRSDNPQLRTGAGRWIGRLAAAIRKL